MGRGRRLRHRSGAAIHLRRGGLARLQLRRATAAGRVRSLVLRSQSPRGRDSLRALRRAGSDRLFGPRRIRYVAQRGRLRQRLGADPCRGELGTVSLRTLGLGRAVGLDLARRCAVGIRAVSLWTLGVSLEPLVLGTRSDRRASGLRAGAGCFRRRGRLQPVGRRRGRGVVPARPRRSVPAFVRGQPWLLQQHQRQQYGRQHDGHQQRLQQRKRDQHRVSQSRGGRRDYRRADECLCQRGAGLETRRPGVEGRHCARTGDACCRRRALARGGYRRRPRGCGRSGGRGRPPAAGNGVEPSGRGQERTACADAIVRRKILAARVATGQAAGGREAQRDADRACV